MKIPIVALIVSMAAPAFGAVGNVRVTGLTNTQAILQYNAPDGNACQLQVSENSNYSPLVNDVDPTKFAGANLDNRAGNITNGVARTFVVGRRVAQQALDSNRYSRALQANTIHYYRITCPSTGDTSSGQFTTTNIPMGRTYIEPQPVDPLNPGQYAWPTLSMSDRTQRIVDPQTGALIKRVSLPNDRAITTSNLNQPFVVARATGWTNAAAALVNDTQSATIAGDNTHPLFISPEYNGGYAGYISFFKGSHGANVYSLDYFQVVLNAATSNASCNTTATVDCKIVVCLTIDAVNCYSGATQYQQALTTTLTNYTFGTASTPIDLWQLPGNRPLNGTEVATKNTLVNCDGSANVTWGYGDYFATYWSPGSTITINGTDYKISTVNSLTGLTLTSSCPAGTGIQAYATNFGVLIKKLTTSADTVSVQYGYSNYQLGVFPYWDFSGEYDLCSVATVVGPTGNPGYNCSTLQNGAMYWIDSITGEAHLFALNQGQYNTPSAACGQFDSVPFDATNPDIWYCGGTVPQKAQYFGNHLEPTDVAYPGHLEEGQNLPTCNGSTNPTNQPCLLITALTGTTDLPTLTTAFDSTFQSDRFQGWYFAAIENGVLIFRNWRSGYGSIGWTVLFDPKATSNNQPGNAGCVGSGLPGCVVAAFPSWNRPGARWCTQKSNDFFGVTGWTAIGAYVWTASTAPGTGPYVSTVNDGTAFSNLAGASGGLANCPANPFNVTGQQCTTVTVDGEPRDPSPCTGTPANCFGAVETGLPGELGNAAPGDYFMVNGNGEQMRLLVKNGNQWTFQRGYDFGGALNTTPANPALWAVCNIVPNPITQQQPAGEFFWNYAADPHGYNVSGNTVLGDNYSVNAHFFSQAGIYTAAYTFDSRCPATGFGSSCYQVRSYSGITDLVVTPPTAVVQQNPIYASKTSPADPNEVQQHPGGPGVNAPPNEKQYFWDGRPFNGGLYSGSAISDGSSPATLVSGQLWKFTAAQVPSFDRKFMATFAFAGYKPLLDVSGPGSVIGTSSTDSYKYCVSDVASECVAGSVVGDVYINAPFVSRPYCHFPGQAGQMADEFDLCITNNAMVFNSIMQVGAKWTDNMGKYQRSISKALTRNRLMVPFYHAHALSNARWLLTKTEYGEEVSDTLLSIKVPPPPTPDSINRGEFIPMHVMVKPPPSLNVTKAYVEFGYSENGPATSFYCTTRAEVCAVGPSATANQINLATPFYFETSEAAQLAGTPCSGGCDIAVPGVSGRVLYGRIIYVNAAGTIVDRGEPFAYAVP